MPIDRPVPPAIGITPGVGVADGLAATVAVALGVVEALAVGVADELMNRAMTFRVICCAAGLTREGLGLQGLTSLRPLDH